MKQKNYKRLKGFSVSPKQFNQSLLWKFKTPITKSLAERLMERISSMLNEIAFKTVPKEEDSDWLGEKK